jgi:hypothetical protein
MAFGARGEPDIVFLGTGAAEQQRTKIRRLRIQANRPRRCARKKYRVEIRAYPQPHHRK